MDPKGVRLKGQIRILAILRQSYNSRSAKPALWATKQNYCMLPASARVYGAAVDVVVGLSQSIMVTCDELLAKKGLEYAKDKKRTGVGKV